MIRSITKMATNHTQVAITVINITVVYCGVGVLVNNQTLQVEHNSSCATKQLAWRPDMGIPCAKNDYPY